MTRAVEDYSSLLEYVIAPDATLEEAKSMMEQGGVRHLPVLEGDRVLGMITLSDLFVHGHLLGADDDSAVRELMARELYVVDGRTPLAEVARTMVQRRVGSAIVTRAGKPAPMFTATDALRALADVLEAS